MILRIVSWLVVHAVALMVFGRIVGTFVPLFGLPSLAIFAPIWILGVACWAWFATHESSLWEAPLICCFSLALCYGVLFFWTARAFGAHWTESLRKVGPYFGTMIAPALLVAQAGLAYRSERPTNLAKLRELVIGFGFQVSGLIVYVVKKRFPELDPLGSISQLTLAYLVIVCPAFWYSRFFVAYVRSKNARVPIAVLAALAAVGTSVLAF
jgi:hypothetical protein